MSQTQSQLPWMKPQQQQPSAVPAWMQKGSVAMPGMAPAPPQAGSHQAPAKLPWQKDPAVTSTHQEVLPSGALKTVETTTETAKQQKDGVEITRTKRETVTHIAGSDALQNLVFKMPKMEEAEKKKKNVWQPSYVPPLPERQPTAYVPVEGEYIPDPNLPPPEAPAVEEGDEPLPADVQKKLQPAPDEEGSPMSPKKAYGSSAYFEEGESKYPTVEEQVKMCKVVAQTLTSPKNVKSRGSKMFFKRQTRAKKWTVSNMPDDDAAAAADDDGSDSEGAPTTPDSATTREGVPRFLLKPSAFEEMKQREHIEMSDHKHVQPRKCFDLANQLQTTTHGRGAKLFHKRQERSEKWVHDETTVPQSAHGGEPEARPEAVRVELEKEGGKAVEYGETFNVKPKGWQAQGALVPLPGATIHPTSYDGARPPGPLS